MRCFDKVACFRQVSRASARRSRVTGQGIMDFYQVAGTDVRLSRVVLGGHEYLPNGNSRGFNEDFAKAITPGHSFPGFGGAQRKSVLAAAYDVGVNFFDVTLDAEK